MKTKLSIKDKKALQVLADIKTVAKEIIGEKIVKIILYGSYARNEQDYESDIDIMLLIDDDEENINKYDDLFTNVAFELSLKHDVLISIILKSNTQFKKYLDILPFYMNVENEGVEFYGR